MLHKSGGRGRPGPAIKRLSLACRVPEPVQVALRKEAVDLGVSTSDHIESILRDARKDLPW